ncbi:uncharacterized protein MYCFIDRAFT_36323 [Pseudocercospora fijiensis CIRAD86]|uniref:Uncharacterized protein n=1 Tax=Pseudocercospora fijiensis (strain CIRAD86) TaxID=383855 RepID=M3ADZ6_PSEFD|nr:uncharacterized protein MYCFIDRAFT_36323 [Pseudocercospora fijiensis CIRAD86]EME82751.1 hypothetical protein MYCFIDRAFT_36323 [Pseudocercospora fijiensis CIRAD86]
MAQKTNTLVAVLDDYAGTSTNHFARVQGLKVDHFPETLNAAKSEGLKALVERLRPYEVISSMRERTAFPAELQNQLPNLKLLMTTGTRNASIDLNSATENNIIVTGTKGDRPANQSADYDPPPPAGQSTVNQHAWALLLSLCGRIVHDDRALKTSPTAWQSSLIITIPGKTLGLLGLGKLGTMMAKTAISAFDMNVIAWSENLTQEKADAAAENAGFAKGVFKVVSKEELFTRSDFVSLHVVLSERSRGVVGKRELGLMKKSAVLLNTSRGGLIDEQALIATLKEGGIEGFATDVFWEEPLGADSVWRKSEDWAKSAVVLSPHMGYVNAGTMNRWYDEQAEILEHYLRGEELPTRLN